MKEIMADVRTIYQGCITLGRDGDARDVLCLVNPKNDQSHEPLASQIYDAMQYQRRRLTVVYHITDEAHTEDELTMMLITKLCGVSVSSTEYQINYHHRYSELTGYLWTDEDIVVGGHDIMRELTSFIGKWCFMIVTIHED